MANPIYTYPSDEVGAAATVSLATGTADASYPVANVADTNPAKPFLTSSSGTDVDVLWDHGTATDVQVFSLHHYNIPSGTNVRIQRNAANSWGAPTMDVAVTLPTYPNSGLPLPVAIDLTIQTGYSAGGFRYTRLHVPTLAQKVGIGSALLWSTKRQNIRPLRFPFVPAEQQPTRKWSTHSGVTNKYRHGFRLRSVEGTISTTTDYANWIAWWRAAEGDFKAFLYWLDPAGSDGWLSAFGADATNLEYSTATVIPATVVIEELACGAALPTS